MGFLSSNSQQNRYPSALKGVLCPLWLKSQTYPNLTFYRMVIIIASP